MSKGSNRRPAAVSAVEAERNWARTFGNADSERCKGAPRDQNAETIPRHQISVSGPENAIQALADMWQAEYRRILTAHVDHPISPTEGA